MQDLAPALTFGPFCLPADLDLLYRGEEVLPLEPRAVQVLRYLVQNTGRVVGKNELLDQVWAGRFVTEGVLKRAICQIRRTLESQLDGAATITTYHRRGYRLNRHSLGAIAATACADVTTGTTSKSTRSLHWAVQRSSSSRSSHSIS